MSFASCSQDVIETNQPSEGTKKTLRIKVSVPDAESRAIDSSSPYAIHSLYIVTFNGDGAMVGSGAVTYDTGQVSVSDDIEISTNYGETVTVYAVANLMNSTVLRYVGTLTEFQDLVTKVADPANLQSGKISLNGADLSTSGQVMVSDGANATITENMQAVSLTLHAQCAKVHFNINLSKAGTVPLNPVTILDYQLCHVPLSSYLLGRSVSDATEVVAPEGLYGNFPAVHGPWTDSFSFDSYIYENHSGTNSNIDSEQGRNATNATRHASYLSLRVKYGSAIRIYRFYLGTLGNNDYSNFNVNRHYDYTMNVNLYALVEGDQRSVSPGGDPNVGDYLFSDGTWGALVTNEVTASHYPIAVVFSTSPTETDRAAGFTHGYAVAIASAGAQLKWASSDAAYISTAVNTPVTTIDAVKADRDGRTKTAAIAALSDYSKAKYPSVWYATHFGSGDIGLTNNGSVSESSKGSTESKRYNSSGFVAPLGTSGWFLGSIGQYWEIAKNLGTGYSESSTILPEGGANPVENPRYWYISGGSEANKNAIVERFSAAKSVYTQTDNTELSYAMPWLASTYETWYWTSSEFSAANGFGVDWDSSGGNFNLSGSSAKSYSDTSNRGVRPVIAF